MRLHDAVEMLRHDAIDAPGKKVWADLGCGNGTFTLALAALQAPHSLIYAMDSSEHALQAIPSQYNNLVIKKQTGDFVTNELPFENLDGILMANSLHYVKDKISLLPKIKPFLNNDGRFLIVEYDTERPNRWVPYPISFLLLHDLFSSAGYKNVKKIRERRSIYNNNNLYYTRH